MTRFGTLSRFCLVWLLYWVIYFLQPVHSAYGGMEVAWLLQFVFVTVLSIAYVIASLFVPLYPRGQRGLNRSFDTIEATSVIRWGLGISLAGFGLLLYDKIFIQGIDYSQGLAHAREQWRVLGEEREGAASSLFSALGYVFGGAYFLSLALTISRFVHLSDSRRFFYLLFGIGLLLVNSVATGGRSSILLVIAFGCFGYFSSQSRYFPPLFRRSLFWKALWGFAAITGTYVLYVFQSRAVASELDVATYSIDFLEFLGLEPEAWFVQFAHSSGLGGVLALFNLAISYLTHSIVTTAAIVEHAGVSGDAIFLHFISLGAKIGLLEAPTEWFLSGRFPSVPGALYLQFGLVGLVLGAGCLGLLAGVLSTLFHRCRDSIPLFFMCAIVESILLLSPFLFMGDFLFFPFLVFGGAMSIVFSRFFGRRKV